MSYRVRQMETGDASAVSSLIERSFAPTLHKYIPYCQPGVANYFTDQLEHGHTKLAPPLEQVVADAQDRIVGHAELRLVAPNVVVLSYLTVDESHRGRGLATDLIRSICSRVADIHRLAVDVFDSNHAALRLYNKLGGVICGTNVWSVAAAPRAEQKYAAAIVTNELAARVSLKRYGFCQANVSLGPQRVHYDLPSVSVVRITDAASRPIWPVSAIKRITPIKEVLWIGPQESAPPSGQDWSTVLRSLRLSLPIQNLLFPQKSHH